MAGAARTGHAERMADGYGAAVHVIFFRINAQPIAAVEALAREGFVQFPDIDVVHGQALPFEQLGHGKYRADTHFIRLASGHRPGNKAPQRFQPAPLCLPGLHQ